MIQGQHPLSVFETKGSARFAAIPNHAGGGNGTILISEVGIDV